MFYLTTGILSMHNLGIFIEPFILNLEPRMRKNTFNGESLHQLREQKKIVCMLSKKKAFFSNNFYSSAKQENPPIP